MMTERHRVSVAGRYNSGYPLELATGGGLYPPEKHTNHVSRGERMTERTVNKSILHVSC